MKNTSLELVARENSAYHADTGISRVVLADNDVRLQGCSSSIWNATALR